VVLSSFAPAHAGGIVRSEAEVDWAGAWRAFAGGLSAKARLGAYLGLAIAMLAPLWAYGRLASLAALSRDARARALDVLLTHRVYLVRELVLMLKVCACMAMFRSSAVRERSGYDRPAPSSALHLPVLRTEAA
jgi:hypothetical protein